MNLRCSPVVVRVADGNLERYLFWCPACHCTHHFLTNAPGARLVHKWNENEVTPTASPSILAEGPHGRCHIFMHQGFLQYAPDSDHAQAGQTIDMVPALLWFSPPDPG